MSLPEQPHRQKEHVLLWAEASESDLLAEVEASLGRKLHSSPDQQHRTYLTADFLISLCSPLPRFAFLRQILPWASFVQRESVRDWTGAVFSEIARVLPDDKSWALHIEPHYGLEDIHRIGARAWHTARSRKPQRRDDRLMVPDQPPQPFSANAGRNRCRLIREALVELLERKRRHLLRNLRSAPEPFTREDSLVQLLLTSPTTGFVSVAQAPTPFEQRHVISHFPKGCVRVPSDHAAPSRAFAKLLEAEMRLGLTIQPGQTCVDLGAAPGSWTYIAARRGAYVIAVDRSPLRDDLMPNNCRHVQFQKGDAFGFRPANRVDWLLCDVIAAPERSAELLLNWLRARWCRHFVVTIKLKEVSSAGVVQKLKSDLPPLTSDLRLTRLNANKKEICAFGTALER